MSIFTPIKTQGSELNTLLRGVHMGIDSYKHLIEKSKSPVLKNILTEILQNYKNHEAEISRRIMDLNEIPVDSVGFTGKITEIFSDLKTLTMNSDSEVLTVAYEGCKTGVIMTQKFLEDNSTLLDDVSINIIRHTIHEDEKYLQKLDEFNGSIPSEKNKINI